MKDIIGTGQHPGMVQCGACGTWRVEWNGGTSVAVREAPADPWQPIDTAPKGYDPEKGWTYVLFWGVSSGRSFNNPVVVTGWMDGAGKPIHSYSYRLRITHWAPHPSPPRAALLVQPEEK